MVSRSGWRVVLRSNLDRLLVGLLALAVLIVLAQIASRVVGRPLGWTEEATRYSLVWLGLLGGARAWLDRAHLAIGWRPLVSRRFVEIVVAGFAVVVLIGGGLGLVVLTAELGQRSAALGIPLAVVYAALPLAGAIMAVDAVAGGDGER